MGKVLNILGDGQIWDLKGILPEADEKSFEDLFSGRALAQLANEIDQQYPPKERVFARFREKGRITGLSVTKALLSNTLEAKERALTVLKSLAQNGAFGIEALTKGKGFKKNWPGQKREDWRNLGSVIIGGGVSEGLTGRVLVRFIKEYLSQDSLSHIQVHQAKFPGKEAGFLGAVIHILDKICNEAKRNKVKKIAGIGIDLGRDEIGVGLVLIEPRSGKIVKQKGEWRLFKRSVKVPYKKHLHKFLDSRRDYTKSERRLGRRIRMAILERMADLIIAAKRRALNSGVVCSQNISVAIPGSTSSDGFILNSTDYLPFLRKQDGFHFALSLERILEEKGLTGQRVYIINDGIAAGISNIHFDLAKLRAGKVAFLGVGSGLGGCLGLLNRR